LGVEKSEFDGEGEKDTKGALGNAQEILQLQGEDANRLRKKKEKAYLIPCTKGMKRKGESSLRSKVRFFQYSLRGPSVGQRTVQSKKSLRGESTRTGITYSRDGSAPHACLKHSSGPRKRGRGVWGDGVFQ